MMQLYTKHFFFRWHVLLVWFEDEYKFNKNLISRVLPIKKKRRIITVISDDSSGQSANGQEPASFNVRTDSGRFSVDNATDKYLLNKYQIPLCRLSSG